MKEKTHQTGLFFGSFNPIHIGHMIIASYMVEFAGLDEVWFVISPHNPLKEKSTLLPDANRLYMVNIAVEDDPRFRASNIEFHMPRPSYTIDTLIRLQEQYPTHQFALLAGSDILGSFHKWKNYESLLAQVKLIIYPRYDSRPSEFDDHPSIRFVDAPLLEISASFIRKAIKEGKNMQYFLPEKVWKYIDEMMFYR